MIEVKNLVRKYGDFTAVTMYLLALKRERL